VINELEIPAISAALGVLSAIFRSVNGMVVQALGTFFFFYYNLCLSDKKCDPYGHFRIVCLVGTKITNCWSRQFVVGVYFLVRE
jgi:hypothetical protein